MLVSQGLELSPCSNDSSTTVFLALHPLARSYGLPHDLSIKLLTILRRAPSQPLLTKCQIQSGLCSVVYNQLVYKRLCCLTHNCARIYGNGYPEWSRTTLIPQTVWIKFEVTLLRFESPPQGFWDGNGNHSQR